MYRDFGVNPVNLTKPRGRPYMTMPNIPRRSTGKARDGIREVNCDQILFVSSQHGIV